ncbi:MAG TPA: RNA polymerase sigma factor [Acidimicrobiia bacterium]|jgi:RNA polymerase sigma-70 factor (ECF subfamily)|nr:RNA polymerase sigma factor [Acidimicrobiia bacterium]
MDDLRIRLAEDLDGTFPELVEGLQSELFSGLRSLAGGDAEDLAQETFIRAYRALSDYDADRVRNLSLRGWIWTIALNLGRNHLRDRARRPTVAGELFEIGQDDPEPPDWMAWNARLQQLSLPIRKAVVLRHVVGLDYPEISSVTGRPVGTVKADVHRGLQRLRTIMEDEE